MRSVFRLLITALAIVLGSGVLSPLVQANWQAWAQKTGNDQYLIRYADSAMTSLVELAQTSWFVFITGFFIGGAVCLWLDFWLRRSASPTTPVTVKKISAADLSHALYPVGGSAMHVIVDQRKKMIQLGFRLKNSAGVPLRYEVGNISAVIGGKTVMNAKATNKGGVVAKDDVTTFFFAPIPYTIGKKDVNAEAGITYTYGLAGVDEPQLRETNYRVNLTISPTSHHYVIVSENDAEI